MTHGRIDAFAAPHVATLAMIRFEPNGVVGPIHPKAMPVLLTTPEEWSTWLAAPTEIALELQRPLPDKMMRIVASGARRDPPE